MKGDKTMTVFLVILGVIAVVLIPTIIHAVLAGAAKAAGHAMDAGKRAQLREEQRDLQG